jgi:hypothetical protein
MTWLRTNVTVLALSLSLSGAILTHFTTTTAQLVRIEEHLRFIDLRLEHLER